MPRGSFREGWGNDYSFEPLDVYGQKESQRAADLVAQASQAKYGTPDPAEGLSGGMNGLRRLGQTIAPPQQPDDGGFFGRVKGLASDVRDTAGDVVHGRVSDLGTDAKDAAMGIPGAAMNGLDTLSQYVGKPAFGILGAALQHPADAVTGEHDNVFEQLSDPKGYIGAVAEGIRHPQRAAHAMDARAKGYGPIGSAAAGVAEQPLSYLGPGVVGAGTRALPASLQGSKAVQITGSILNQGTGRTVVASALGSLGAQKGAEALGLPDWAQQGAAIAGAAAGGLAPHFAPKALGAIRNAAVKLDTHINEPIPLSERAPESFPPKLGAVDEAGNPLPHAPIGGASQDVPFGLPPELAGSKPRYSYGSKRFQLQFTDDLDKALYTVASQTTDSKKHGAFMDALSAHLPDKSPEEIRALGAEVKDSIKAQAKVARPEDGPLVIESTGVAKPREVIAPEATPPAVAPVPPEVPPTASEAAVTPPATEPVAATPIEAAIQRGSRRTKAASSPPATPPGAPPTDTTPAPAAAEITPEPLDLLRTKAPVSVVTSGADYAATKKGQIRTMGSKAIEALPGEAGISDPTVTAIKKEYEATGHRVVEIPRVMRTRLEADARAAGLNFTQDENGVWTIDGHPEADVGQVIEANTPEAQAVRDSLSDAQRAVFDKMKAFTGEVNQTMEARGLTVPHRETETGDYLARMVLGRETENGFTPKGGTTGSSSRVIGSNKLGPRTEATMTGAAEKGIRYANLWDAFEASNRAKLRMAQDAYVGDLVKPLGVKDAGVGSGMRPLKGDHPAFATKQAVGNAFDGEHVVTVDKPLKFKDDIARQLDSIFNPNPASATTPGKFVSAINSATIPIRAAFDMSAVGGRLGFLVSSPTNFVKGLKAVPQVVKSAMGHPEAIDALRKAENDRTLSLLNKAGVEASDGAVYHVQRNLHLVGEEGGEELNFGKTSAIRAGADKVGLGKAADALDKGMAWSNETFNRYLDYARHVMANDALERGISKGLKGGELDKFVEESNQGVNRVTGYTNTKPSSLESMLLFAPRFNRSMVEEIGALTKMGSQEQAMAVKHLGTMLVFSAATVGAWNQAHGYDTTLDPRDPNFLAARNVFGQDVKPLGSLSTLFRGISELAAGKPGEDNLPNPTDAAKYFGRSKASPALGSLWSAIVGSNYNGESFDFKTPGDAAKALLTIGKEALPFSAQAGVNEGPLGALTSATGFNASPMTPGEQRDFKRDDIAKQTFGTTYDKLSGPQKAKVNQDSGVMGLDKRAQNNALDQADSARSKPAEAQRDFQAAMTGNDKFLAAHQTPDGKPFSGVDYRKSYIDLAKTRRDFLAGAGVKGGSDAEVDGFFALYDKAKMENGATNFDQLDQLQADYASRHPGVLAKIASETGTKDTPTMQAMRTAMGQAKEYYQIPKYTGMSAADAQRADNVINQAAPLTANGVVGSRQAAYQYLVDHGRVSLDDLAIANQATRAGTNPERKAFKVSHPEFAQFYGGVSSEDVGSIGTVASSSGASSIPGIRGIGSSRSSSSAGGGSLSRVQARRAGGLRR